MNQTNSYYVEQGIQLGKADNYKDAEAAFRQAIQLNPSGADSHSYLGITLYIQGKLEEAIS
ncbi:MAG: tetratricopeptide repeat protein [Leptolyngbyaceae cyanobacterium]